jgi:preprotein translocase subunit SecG
MTTVLLMIHLFVTLALIGVVLIQRSEGGGLGIGTSQGMGSFMSGRGTANLLTRTTAILGALFFVLSLTLALLNKGTSGVIGRSLLDIAPVSGPAHTGPSLPPLVPPKLPVPGADAPAAPPAAGAPAASAPASIAPAAPAPASIAPAAPAAPAPAPDKPAAPGVPTTN